MQVELAPELTVEGAHCRPETMTGVVRGDGEGRRRPTGTVERGGHGGRLIGGDRTRRGR